MHSDNARFIEIFAAMGSNIGVTPRSKQAVAEAFAKTEAEIIKSRRPTGVDTELLKKTFNL
jgi:hypothetical protein